jgi:SHS2 domain-containing protein
LLIFPAKGRSAVDASLMKHDTMGYELLAHTGDIGIRVWADNLKGLFQEAARALFDIITDRKKVAARLKREVAVQGSGKEELLVAWLNELLYLHEVEELLFCDFALSQIEHGSLRGVARGEKFRQGHHLLKTAIKAVTYHLLEVKELDGRWQARIIFDI